MRRLPKPGTLILLEFLDHVEDGDEPMTCLVVGRLIAKARVKEVEGRRRRYVWLESWFFPTGTDHGVVEQNRKTFCILYSAITRFAELGDPDQLLLRKPPKAPAEPTPPSSNEHGRSRRTRGR